MGFFSNVVNGIKTVTQIVPTVMELVKAFEVPEGAGKGGDKKTAIINIINLVAQIVPEEAKAELGNSKIVQIVAGVIDIIVTFFNAVGVFKK